MSNKTLLVNGMWPITIHEEDVQASLKYHDEQKQSFLWWIADPKQHDHISTHAGVQLFAYATVASYDLGINTVAEHCGGAGVGTTTIQNVLRPKSHIVGDIDPACVTHLKRQKFCGDVDVRLADASSSDAGIGSFNCDLIACDLPFFTATKLKDWHENFTKMFTNNPSVVMLTEVGIGRFWFTNVRKAFSKALGEEVTNPQHYVCALSRYFYRTWGYSVRWAAYRSFVVMLLMEGDTDKISFHKLPHIKGISL